jgi:cytokinin riboside 5'-monophosphate phosphoribohydrolase
MFKNVAVYCSSSDALADEYFAVAKDVGEYLGTNGYNLVWGGANVGLMGQVAKSTKEFGGKIIGVIPKAIEKEKIIFQNADEMIVTEDLYQRKKIMAERTDAFLALAGGFGTIEEIVEVLTLKQLHLHQKPIVFINTRNFFDPLINQFELMYKEKVAKVEYRALYHVTNSVNDAFKYLTNYQPVELPNKWFDKKEK